MQTELHRHLDVSLRLSTLLELAQERGLESRSTSLERFREKIILSKPLHDLREVLGQFTLFQKVLDRPEVLERAAFEVMEDCWNEGTRKVELRFSPSFVSEYSKLSWENVLAGFERGVARALAKYPGMQAGFLCIASRDFGAEAVAETVDFFLKHQNRFVGVDLAGNEENFPCHLFESSFKRAANAGAKITIHAGEATGPENMWEAIELLGARRIGHGIAAVRDPKLMEYLARHGICLEMCPTSNWLTRAVDSFEAHPLPQVLRAGVPVCINTDDPGVFSVGMPDEIRICREKMGMTPAEIQRCHEHASGASFIATLSSG
ncbi:MAG: adenosine deaminase [Oligoflexia bacterium]|nr:adenosine deaminase [Oligoflexia bacterium]